MVHLDCFVVEHRVVHFEDRGSDAAWLRQRGEADVDGVAALRVKHTDVLLGSLFQPLQYMHRCKLKIMQVHISSLVLIFVNPTSFSSVLVHVQCKQQSSIQQLEW